MTKLILVEGLQGCGKTTISKFVSDELTRRGVQCTWCKEDAEHPTGKQYVPEKYDGVDDYMDKAVKRWSAFAAGAAQADHVTVMDGRLLMCPVAGLLRHDVGAGEIHSFVLALSAAASSLGPVLVYLYSPDYPSILSAMCRRRGERTRQIYIERNDKSPYARGRGLRGYEGLVRFWMDHKEITEKLVEELHMPKISLDVSDLRWDAYRQRIIQFLRGRSGLPLGAR